MEEFLKETRNCLENLEDFKKVKVVLGNRSSDLDSVVCALVYGFFLDKEIVSEGSKDIAVLPVINVPKDEFRLKTEVRQYLRSCKLSLDLLIFRDEVDLVDLQNNKKLELTLVDHHAPAEDDVEFADSVVEIIDHRPQDKNWPWKGLEKMTLETVGSCASLIGKKILCERPDIMEEVVCKLLRGPILIDTYNLSKEANRAKPLDHEIADKLESLGKLEKDRDAIFQSILDAKTDISELTAEDLLHKDLKIINNIAVPGFPTLVRNFINQRPEALESIENFSEKYTSGLVVLVGMDIQATTLTKDIGIYYSKGNEIAENLIAELEKSMDLQLNLSERVELRKGTLILYRQGNIMSSRKQIIPIVQGAMEKHCTK